MAAFGGIDDWDHEAESSDNFWRRFKEAQTGARARARARAPQSMAETAALQGSARTSRASSVSRRRIRKSSSTLSALARNRSRAASRPPPCICPLTT